MAISTRHRSPKWAGYKFARDMHNDLRRMKNVPEEKIKESRREARKALIEAIKHEGDLLQEEFEAREKEIFSREGGKFKETYINLIDFISHHVSKKKLPNARIVGEIKVRLNGFNRGQIRIVEDMHRLVLRRNKFREMYWRKKEGQGGRQTRMPMLSKKYHQLSVDALELLLEAIAGLKK